MSKFSSYAVTGAIGACVFIGGRYLYESARSEYNQMTPENQSRLFNGIVEKVIPLIGRDGQPVKRKSRRG